MTARVAILISGGGSNMEALVAAMVGEFPARPVLVLSNRPDAGGLAKAEAAGVPTAVVDHKPFKGDRAAFEVELNRRLEAARPDVICQAGFMRILTPVYVDRWAGQVLNIHPSLLPKYPGLNTHQRALDAGDRQHGCSVHEVTADLDAGPILGQAALDVVPGEDAPALARRVLALEHRLYPAVLRRFVEGDRTRIDL